MSIVYLNALFIVEADMQDENRLTMTVYTFIIIIAILTLIFYFVHKVLRFFPLKHLVDIFPAKSWEV